MDENETNCDDSDPEYVPDEVDNEEEMTDQETTPESKVFNRPFYREGYSGIWQFYKKLQPLSQFSARCICCNEIKSYRTTTGNLRMHLKRKHPKAHKKLRKIDAMRRYRSISSYQTRPQSSPQTPVRDLTVWKFYDKVGPDHKKLAKCSFCFNLRSYATTVNNLKTHLAKVHCDTFTKNDELMRSIAGTDLEKIIEKYSKMDRNQRDQDMHDVTPDLSENETEDINVKNENDEDNSQPSQQPPDPTIWKFFNKTRVHADRTARCRLCNRICSYLASVYNLKLHLGKMHHALFKKDEALMQNIAGTDIEKIVEKYSKRSQTVDLYAKVHLSENAADHMNVENGDNYDDSSKSERVNRSAIWKYFTKVEPLKERGARCGLCRRVISYKSTMSNLKKHLDRHTRQEILEYRESYEKQDMWETIENGNDDDDAHNSTNDTGNIKLSTEIWRHFDVEDNEAICGLCRDTLAGGLEEMKNHLEEKHPAVLDDITQKVLDAASEEDVLADDDLYTEVVYLEEEQKKTIEKPDKHKKPFDLPTIKIKAERRASSSSDEIVQKRRKKSDKEPDELEPFVNYITMLLKKVSKEASPKLQMDIINLIMNASQPQNKIVYEPVHFNSTSVLTPNQNNVLSENDNGIGATSSNNLQRLFVVPANIKMVPCSTMPQVRILNNTLDTSNTSSNTVTTSKSIPEKTISR